MFSLSLPFSVNLSTEVNNKLKIYKENFESSYIEAARDYYASHAPTYMAENGVQNYMRYVSFWEREGGRDGGRERGREGGREGEKE